MTDDDEISRDLETFRNNEALCQSTKEEIDRFSVTLGQKGISHIWESRVKTRESLEGKLRNRKRDGKSGLSGIADLVGGRIVLLRIKDSETVTTLIRENFKLDEDPIQHPTSKEHGERLGQRFRGYDGLHFRLRVKGELNPEVVVEIQVLHIIMWMYHQVEHDLGYKGGQNSRELGRALEILKGASNLNAEAFEQFEEVIGNQQSHRGTSTIGGISFRSQNVNEKRTVESQIQVLLDPKNQELFAVLLQSHTTVATQVNQIASVIPILHDSLKKSERQTLFNWLSKLQPKQNHKTMGKDFMAGSGEWLLEKASFQEWRKGKESSILWLHGIPGSGKSKIIYSVIEYLNKEKAQNPAAPPLAFFYCARNASEPERSDPDEIMRSILKQLCCTKVDIPVREPLTSKYKELKEESDDDGVEEPAKLTGEECLTLLVSFLESSPATIVLDALDECDPARRHELLLALDIVIHKSAGKVKLFVSSRDDGDIVCRLGKSPNIYIKVSDNHKDVERFVNSEVQRSIREKRLLGGNVTEVLKTRIMNVLIAKSQGMFRWVSLQIQSLCDSQRIHLEKDVIEELGKLPRTLNASYDILYERIQETASTGRRVAELAMTWLLCAHRPLSTQEFITAVSVDTTAVDTGELYTFLSPSLLLNICCNLVVLDEEMDMFRFAHLSVQEYLEARGDFDKIATNSTALEVCMLVNSLELKSYPRSTTLLSNMQFKNYAITTWPIHCQTIGEALHSGLKHEVIKFLSTRYAAWKSAVRMLRSTPSGTLIYPDINLFTATPLYLVFRFRLLWIFRESDIFLSWWSKDNVSFDEQIFHLAVQNGQEQVLRQLLREKGIVKNGKRRLGRLLLSAVLAGQLEVVELLLREDIDMDLNLKDSQGSTPLSSACASRDSKLVQSLIQKQGVDINTEDNEGRTPLLIACQNIDLEVVRLLLQLKDINVNAKEKEGRTPFAIATLKWDTKLVTLLLENKDVDVNAKDHSGSTPLATATSRGYLEIVKLLLEIENIDVNAKDREGQTPLAIATGKGDLEIVKLLLRTKGVNANTTDCRECTPLLIACNNGDWEVVTLLVQRGVININVKDRKGIPFLSIVVGRGDLEMVALLLQKKVDVNAQDHYGATPLYWARHQPKVSELLLSHGANVVEPWNIYAWKTEFHDFRFRFL